MYIFATFKYNTEIELTLQELEELGLRKYQIMIVPLDKVEFNTKTIDSMHRTDGRSLIDLAAIFGIIFMLLGVIYGYVLSLGPILWGLFGLLFGFVSGFLVDYFFTKKSESKRKKQGSDADLILMIRCPIEKQEKVKDILWNNLVLGVGVVDR
ncbi:hypothetical protein [Sutcliffiella rhizosphaerae]|uniref:Uncharacterized protein n=1 Tax=Sutcliffiella rhizosphaerae TaxID=2880967 RepID=A0ABN8AA77_9BACI|nr:hypothetical protein [Sutcliffiella rhizosphaerae]CAG9620577.1 hypothetical protein BACCIP111883_01346 [Sutcliffiella rhizosphaerae]